MQPVMHFADAESTNFAWHGTPIIAQEQGQ